MEQHSYILSLAQKGYWAILAICLGILIMAITPDKTDLYKNAIKELELIQVLPKKKDDFYGYIRDEVNQKVGIEIHKTVNNKINGVGG
jgi:hypothetical protein